MKKALVLTALAVMLVVGMLSIPAAAGPDLHLKLITYDGDWVLAPGFGVYYLGTTPWGFKVEHSFVEFNFESSTFGCSECDDGEWRFTMAGVWDIMGFYDFDLGGCDPGPCDRGAIRLGAGVGIPGFFGFSTTEGLELGAPELGIIVGIGYVWEHDFHIMAEAYWNGDDVGFGLSGHVDLFSIGDWIRGHEPVTEPDVEL